MPCRLGITTDFARSRREWEEKLPTAHNFWLVEPEPFLTKSRAQSEVEHLALFLGCEYDRIVSGPENARWYVFRFDH